jgi:hypothetical protein
MVKLPVQFLPYFKHFFFVVVVSHLVVAAFFFGIGTLTRNAKIIYGLAALFYPAYVSLQLLWKNLPSNLLKVLDPIAFNFHSKSEDGWSQTADFLNKSVVSYGPYAYANRALMLIYTAIFLFVVYRRFSTHEQTKLSTDHFTILTLPRADDTVPLGLENFPSFGVFDTPIEATPARDRIPLPSVTLTRGLRSTLFKIFAAVETEFRLLGSERSLIVLIPLVVLLSIFDLAFFRVDPEISYSVTYATGTAKVLLFFLVGLIIFFTGETMHRDREVKVRPIIWSTPAPNSVLLLSKCFATALLAIALLAVIGLVAIVIQVFRGHTPVDFTAYVVIYGVVVVPSIVFMTSMVVALNAVLRNKYATYVVAVATSAVLLYLYNIGYNHWTYNPLLYRLWTYADLTSPTMLTRRLYCLGLAAAFLALAHLVFERKS